MDRERKTITHSIHNVQFCPATGYLIEPPNVDIENKIYTKKFLLAYNTIPRSTFRKDYINPVDPGSIICVCSFCRPENRPFPTMTRTIVACAHPLPLIPNQLSKNTWKPMPRRPYVYWSTRRSYCVFQLRWIMHSNDPGANVHHFEVYYYRHIPGKTYSDSNPWKLLMLVRKRKTILGNYRHGGLYHYAVRCVDQYGRRGKFSDPVSLFLTVN